MTQLSWLTKKRNGILPLSSTHAINILVAVLTLPIILTSLPIDDYGKWQFMLALQAWGLVISAPQITDGSKRGIALGQEGTFFFALFARAKWLLVSSGLFLLLGVYFQLTDRGTFALLAGLSAFYLFSNILVQTSIGEFFISKKEFVQYGIWTTISSPVARIGSSVVALYTQSIVLFVLFQIVFATLISIFTMTTLIKRRTLWMQYIQGNYDASCIKFGIRSLPTDILGAISNRLVEVLIGIFFGITSLAYFSVARDLRNQVANMLKMALPLLYADFVKQPIDALARRLTQKLMPMIATSTGLGIIGILLSIAYILFFLPDAFRAAIPFLLILGLAFPIVIPTIIYNTVLESHLRYRAIALATIVPSVIKIVLVIFLGWLWGILGMTVAIALFGYTSFAFFYLATVHRESFKKFLEQSRIMRAIMHVY
ncbi:hypothetical protein EPN81_03050 [Patescibacteria group bacterium]|nr:MAG: hypothetical protein EPN81_03050 [Patescibacteria group bacterium]